MLKHLSLDECFGQLRSGIEGWKEGANALPDNKNIEVTCNAVRWERINNLGSSGCSKQTCRRNLKISQISTAERK
jgi:hypothetical protein